MDELGPLLARWTNFHVSMMQAAAALIGLLFVVIALAAQQGLSGAENAGKVRVYLTPTVVYFASVLVAGALLTFPNHTRLSVLLCISILGIIGLVYSASVLIGNVN